MQIKDGPFDIQEGGWNLFEKNSLFPYKSEKNKMSSKVKDKKFVLHSMNLFKAHFPGSYK